MMAALDFLRVTEADALEAGATHNGYLFGLPVWITLDGSDCPAVATKFRPAEYVLTVCLAVYAALQAVGFLEQGFDIYIDGPIQ
jgi:hypothetical protein